MKITRRALQKLIQESIKGSEILRERPWSVEYNFKLTDGTATDSEGVGPDGFAIVMTGDSGTTVRIVIDSHWNPNAGDESGNSLKLEVDGELVDSTYVPARFDDGKMQKLIISNAPVSGMMTVSHSPDLESLTVVHLVVENPFAQGEDVSFDVETLGNGTADVELVNHVNL